MIGSSMYQVPRLPGWFKLHKKNPAKPIPSRFSQHFWFKPSKMKVILIHLHWGLRHKKTHIISFIMVSKAYV